MPRDPSKLKKADLVREIREKHGGDQIFVEVEPTEENPLPEPEYRDANSFTKTELLERFGGVLDTTTEEEREDYARQQVERENKAAS